MDKNGFVLHRNHRRQISKLTVEEKAALLDAIYAHADGEEVGALPGQADIVFDVVAEGMDAEAAKRAAQSEKQRARVTKRWAKTDTAEYHGIPRYTTVCHGKDNSNNNINNNTNTVISKNNIPPYSPPKGANEAVVEIIDYLNSKTGSKYRPTTPKTIRDINARLKEGFTVDDFKKVIDTKCNDWLGDEHWARFLRPETLFSTKFEGYLNQLSHNGRKLSQNGQNDEVKKSDDEAWKDDIDRWWNDDL